MRIVMSRRDLSQRALSWRSRASLERIFAWSRSKWIFLSSATAANSRDGALAAAAVLAGCAGPAWPTGAEGPESHPARPTDITSADSTMRWNRTLIEIPPWRFGQRLLARMTRGPERKVGRSSNRARAGVSQARLLATILSLDPVGLVPERNEAMPARHAGRGIMVLSGRPTPPPHRGGDHDA